MRSLRLVTTVCLIGCAGPALADDFIPGVWLPTTEACDQAKADGVAAVLEEGSLALTAEGLHGYEYHCDFLAVLRGKRTPAWTVTALCEEPGFAFSDLITITPRSEGELDLTSLATREGVAEGEMAAPGSLEQYVRCEGVSLP